MPSVLNEHTQFTDISGRPIVSGKVYFGVQGADPTVSLITIYSDRELTTVITNPQVLDSLGRTANKVWVDGRYSIRVDDLNDSQIYQELDNGETLDKGVTVLENVSGGNTIVATAATTITQYEDLEQYTFRTVQANTDAVTLNIDTVGAKSVVKNHDQPILKGEFEADQNIIVSRNETDDVFEWVNQNNKVVDFYEGTAVVSAATADIWVEDGNTLHLTGNTGPVTSFDTAPAIGAVRWVICDSTPTFTHSANLNLPGNEDFTASAGDLLRVYADTTTQFDVSIFKADGTAVSGSGLYQSIKVFGYPTAYSDDFTTNFAVDANALTIAAAPTEPFVTGATAWRFTTTTTLPSPLALATDYFIVAVNATDEIEVALTPGGAAVTLTDNGTGTHTIAPLGTWTKPAGLKRAEIIDTGGGGGGQDSDNTAGRGKPGGGGGGTSIKGC